MQSKQSLFWVFTFCANLAHATTFDVSTLVIGVATRADYPPQANPAICAMEMAIRDINADPSVLPLTVLHTRVFGTNCSTSKATTATLHASLGNHMDASEEWAPMVGIVGPYCSSAAAGLSQVAAYAHIPVVAFGASAPSLSDKSKYPW